MISELKLLFWLLNVKVQAYVIIMTLGETNSRTLKLSAFFYWQNNHFAIYNTSIHSSLKSCYSFTTSFML